MKITFDKNLLLKPLQVLAEISANGTGLADTKLLKINALDGSDVAILEVYNGVLMSTLKIPSKVDEAGVIVVNSETLFKTVKGCISSDDEFKLSTTSPSSKCRFTNGKTKGDFPQYPIDNFNGWCGESFNTYVLSIQSSVLLDILNQASKVKAENCKMMALRCLNIKSIDNHLHAFFGDGIYMMHIETDIFYDADFSISIPLEHVNTLKKFVGLAGKNDSVNLYKNDNQYALKVGESIISVPVLNDDYPKVMPLFTRNYTPLGVKVESLADSFSTLIGFMSEYDNVMFNLSVASKDCLILKNTVGDYSFSSEVEGIDLVEGIVGYGKANDLFNGTMFVGDGSISVITDDYKNIGSFFLQSEDGKRQFVVAATKLRTVTV